MQLMIRQSKPIGFTISACQNKITNWQTIHRN